MDISLISGVTDLLHINHAHDSMQLMFTHPPLNWPLLAQKIKDPEVLENIQRAFNNFIKSGQVWAFCIGLALGYIFRNLTP